MTSQFVIDLVRSGSDVAWGFRLQGGSEYGAALSIQRVFSGTPADGNLQRGDLVSKVNGNDVTHLTLNQAQELIKLAGHKLSLNIHRDSHSQQDFHVSAQAPSFAPSDYHHSPPRHPPNQPPQQFHSNAFPTQPIVTSPVSNLKFQPKPDHEPHYNQHNFQPHSDHPPPQHHDWQPHHAPSSSEPHHQHHHHEHEEFHHEEHSGDVDDEHLRPVKEIKSMFNHGGGSRDSAHVVRKGHPVRVAQPRKPQATTKYQPPSPAIKPAVATHVQSAKHPPVYQQRSSYNPLDFQGVTPKSPIPASRPPGLIQRGAVELKPRGTSLDYQPPSHFKPDHHHQNVSQPQQHHQPTITPQGNLDPLTDFYLHGLNAKSELPDFTKSQTASYSGKILPPRSEVAIKTPTSSPKKKEFHAEQSAVYRILQEEEDARQRGRGGQAAGKGSEEGKRYQIPAASGGSRLAELLEKDQAQLAPYHEDDHQHPQHPQHPQHHQQQQHPQHHHQQQQYQQHHHQQQQYQQHHEQQQQYQQQHQQPQQQYQQHQHSPTKHTSTAQFVPSPSHEQAPRHDYNDYHGNYQQQHHYQNWTPQDAGRRHVAHTGLPETDF